MKPNTHPLDRFKVAAAAMAAAAVLGACGGGGGDAGSVTVELDAPVEADFDHREDTPQKRANDAFDEIVLGAVAQPNIQEISEADCTGTACDVAPPGGDVVGKDMVMAINDPSTADDAALIRRAALAGDEDLPPSSPGPTIPDLGDSLVASSSSAADDREHAQSVVSTPKRVSPGGVKAQRVKILATFPSSPGEFHCSGTLVDSRWVVTSAHCVYHVKGAKYPKSEYAKSVTVIPAFGHPTLGQMPYGRAHSDLVLVRDGWRQEENIHFDTAWVRLIRPIGGHVGYHDFKRFNCDQFKSQTFVLHGYPADQSFSYPDPPHETVNGKQMVETKVGFEECKLGDNNVLRIGSNVGVGGQSGSGLVLPGATSGYGGMLTGTLSTANGKVVRLSNNAVKNIREWIGFSIPSKPDLAPVSTAISSSTAQVGVVPRFNPGDKVRLASHFHNLSLSQFSGDFTYTVYLSKNDQLSKLDTPVTSFKVKNKTIGGKSTIVDSPEIKIPCRPSTMASGDTVYLGVVIADKDADVSNNDSSKFSAPLKISGTACK